MLASLLPGLRDLRVPLATGFLWLVVLWLVCYPVIPTQAESTGLAAEVYVALGAFGPAALITVITFVAYLVGILVARPSVTIVRWVLARFGRTGFELSAASRTESQQLAFRTAAAMADAGAELPRELVETRGPSKSRNPGSAAAESESAHRRSPGYVVQFLTERMESEIPLVATRLLADNRDLFDRYDRAESEAAFRFSIPLPLFAISCLVPWRLELSILAYVPFVLGGMAVAVLLLADGSRKQSESNDAIFQAVFVDKADFPSIEAARAVIEQQRDLDNQKKQAFEQRRAEREARERAAQQTAAAARQSELEAESASIEQARRVSISLAGGAGQGAPSELQMTSVNVEIANDSREPVVVDKIELLPPLVAKRLPRLPIRLASHDSESMTIEVNPIDIYPNELSGAPLSRFEAKMTFRLDGRRLVRSSSEQSEPAPSDG